MKKYLHFKTSFVLGIFILMLSFNLKSQCAATFTVGSTAPLTWTVNPTYAPGTAGAIWYWGDGNSTVGLYPSHTYTSSNWYSICVSVWNSPVTCSATTCDSSFIYRVNQTANAPIQISVINATATAIQEISAGGSIGLFPNPSSGKVTLVAQKQNSTISIYNMLGVKVQEVKVESNTATDLNLSAFENGIYFVEFNNGKNIRKEKIILNK